jgi:hypothetical protein
MKRKSKITIFSVISTGSARVSLKEICNKEAKEKGDEKRGNGHEIMIICNSFVLCIGMAIEMVTGCREIKVKMYEM